MKQRKYLITQAVLLGIAAIVLWLALRTVSWREVAAIVRGIDPRSLLLVALLNVGIMLSMSARWWLLLRGFGHTIPFRRIVRYRTTIFGLSYITPGPQMGGEVLQVYYPTQSHGVPLPVSLAVASVDKTLEWVGNFTFLAIGTFAVLIGQHIINQVDEVALGAIALLMLIPLALIIQVWRGRHPISGFIVWIERKLPHRHRLQLRQMAGLRSLPSLKRLEQTLYHSEEIIASLHRSHPRELTGAVFLTFLTWCLILAEFWTITQALDLPLHPAQAAGALVMVYLAFLLPMPAGLGAMEAALVLAFTAYDYSPEQALSLGLLIRARDLVITVTGLFLGGLLWERRAGSGPPAAGRGAPLGSADDVPPGLGSYEAPPGPSAAPEYRDGTLNEPAGP